MRGGRSQGSPSPSPVRGDFPNSTRPRVSLRDPSGQGERRRFPAPKERLGGTKCFAGIDVPILPLSRRSLGLEKLEMATQELSFVCVPHRSEQELGEAGCLPVGGVVRILLTPGPFVSDPCSGLPGLGASWGSVDTEGAAGGPCLSAPRAALGHSAAGCPGKGCEGG